MKRTALVTGANRGIGLETCRQLAQKGYRVALTCRDRSRGEEAVETLRHEGLGVVFRRLDVTVPDQVSDVYGFVADEFERLDVLINNAGLLLDGERRDRTRHQDQFRLSGLGEDEDGRGGGT